MGLKVLLADDSNAIKKVVQLCLQDFGVDLKTCGNGKDVLEVARQFKPDIALIDIMLPHRPGYDVAGDIKKDPELSKTPVILLWSSFMEFDEKKYQSSGSDDKLEKPFEAKDLRALVSKYVHKTQNQPVANFVDLPKIDFKMEPQKESWNMSAFEDIGAFSKRIDLEKNDETIAGEKTGILKEPTPQEPDSDWVRKDLGKFQVNLEELEENTVSFQIDESKIKDMSFIMKAEVGGPGPHGAPAEAAAPVVPTPTPAAIPTAPKATPPTPAPVTTEATEIFQLETVTVAAPMQAAPVQATPKPSAPMAHIEDMREALEKQISDFLQKEGKEIFAKAIAKVVPALATQMIKEEIERLTQN